MLSFFRIIEGALILTIVRYSIKFPEYPLQMMARPWDVKKQSSRYRISSDGSCNHTIFEAWPVQFLVYMLFPQKVNGATGDKSN